MFINNQHYLLLLVFSFVLFTKQQQPNPAFTQLRETAKADCLKETGITEEKVKAIAADKAANADNPFKCYQKCKFLKMGVMDNAGKVITGGLEQLALVRFNSTGDVVEKCKNSGGSDADLCEAAFSIRKCLLDVLGNQKSK